MLLIVGSLDKIIVCCCGGECFKSLVSSNLNVFIVLISFVKLKCLYCALVVWPYNWFSCELLSLKMFSIIWMDMYRLGF